MLVFTRKLQEAIRIDDNIRIVITHISKNKVRVAIDAPENVHIDREEVCQRRQEFASAGPTVEILPQIIAALSKCR